MSLNATEERPRISVVIPTFDRAGLLRSSLESLTRQSLEKNEYEVIVVDDGSSDDTRSLCESFEGSMGLRYFRIANSGISAAKNLGVFTSRADIVLFFDDDDVAHPDLLAEHVRMHQQHPDRNIAVLGYTTWAADLDVTPLMDFVINKGQMLFAYENLRDGQELDYTYFWGGRSSCKRSLLVKYGVFNQQFRGAMEDIELGYRLYQQAGLKVIFDRQAVSYMIRPITLDEFCRRCERQGQTLSVFEKIHPTKAVKDYCGNQLLDPDGFGPLTPDRVPEKWKKIDRDLPLKLTRIDAIERAISAERGDPKPLVHELEQLYRWIFNAHKLKGNVNALTCPNGTHKGNGNGF